MSVPQNLHQIAELLNEQDIHKIAIIDDAYDPPMREDFLGEIEEFWAEIEFDDSAQMELASLEIEINSADDISEDVLKKLWEKYDSLIALKRSFDAWVLPIFTTRQADLDPLYESLKNDLGRQVDRYGRLDVDKFNDTSAKLIFIDYYLGPPSIQTTEQQLLEASESEAVAAAKRTAKEILGKYPQHSSKPLVVLMSSREIGDQEIAEFRDESELLGGLFHFVAKKDLKDKVKLFLKLGALAKALPYGHKIQKFVDSLNESKKEVAERFLKEIMKLSLEDYAYIQTLSLQDEGQPLGDYMLWLYGAYFGHLLFDDARVREQQNVIDRITFDHLPPSQITPSHHLVEIYKSALFDPVDDIAQHPWSLDNQGSESDQMYLHLGDFFIKDTTSRVLMIISAECDLAFTPASKQRRFKPDRTIMVIPGQLHHLDKELDETERAKVRTELFEYNNETFRILWDTKRVTSYKHGEIRRWLTREGYERKFRLKLPFALEVQRAFAADLTRIGMPVAPPFSRVAKVQLFCEGDDGKVEAITEVQDGSAFLFLTRGGEHFVLTDDFICLLESKINSILERLQTRQANIDKTNKALKKKSGELKKWIRQLRELRENYNALLRLRGPFPLPPKSKDQQLQSHPVQALRISALQEQFKYNQPILIAIIDS